MIVIDTNVVSAMMRPSIDAPVAAWIATLDDTPLAIGAVTLVEITRGLERLPTGKRRRDLSARFEALLAADPSFAPAPPVEILPLDESAARRAGTFLAARASHGKPASDADMMIAGIAAAHGAALATRNVRDFEGLGLTLHDPWRGAAGA